jgi:hypothetical protein
MLLFLLIPASVLCQTQDSTVMAKSAPVKIKFIATDRSEIIVWPTGEDGKVIAASNMWTLSVSGQALKDELKNWRSGDLANIGYTEAAAGIAPAVRVLQDVSQRSAADVRGNAPIWTFGTAMVVALALLLYQRKLIEGEDGHYSLSKLQMAIWFTIVIGAYVATLLIRGFEFGSLGIPTNLMLLSGLSVLTFGGSKLASDNKVASALAAGQPGPSVRPSRGIVDLITDSTGQPDLGDFQMLVVTLLAALVYVVQLHLFLDTVPLRAVVSLPDMDGTLLASLGLGHGAYLVKKAVGNINS